MAPTSLTGPEADRRLFTAFVAPLAYNLAFGGMYHGRFNQQGMTQPTPFSDRTTPKSSLRRRAQAYGPECAHEKDRADQALTALFLKSITLTAGQSLAFFWPLARECDTRPIAHACHAAGVICALPAIQASTKELDFKLWTPECPLVRSRLGTFEPQATAPSIVPDFVLVPLVMADLTGNRLGRGGGYYDATLGPLRRKTNLMAIGVAHEWQIADDVLPAEDHDQRLDALITPERFVIFP